jgi:uncharacterized protein YprB with RNaseH-like and TPR domain
MAHKSRSKVLLFDIEAAGVQGLKADRSFIPVFGYKWLGERSAKTITVLDFPEVFAKNPQDDSALLAAIYPILAEAEGLVAHFGEYFDRPFVEARLAKAKLPPIPNMKLTDTCLIARKRLCLSSNSLKNLGEFAGVETKKMEKGRGWPDWWMGALRGHKPSIRKMAVYCRTDVECLEDIYFWMRKVIPMRHLPINLAIGEATWACAHCGGHRRQSRGHYYSDKKLWQRYQCVGCGAWDRGSKALAAVPKAQI